MGALAGVSKRDAGALWFWRDVDDRFADRRVAQWCGVRTYERHRQYGADRYRAQWYPDGLFATGLDLDGVDDYVEVADATSLNTYATTNEITLEFWLYVRGSTEQNLIAKRDASNVGGFLLTTLNASASLRGYVHMPTSAGSNNGMWPYVDISYTANQWVHVAMTYSDATGLRVYKDGVLANTLPVTGALNSVGSPMRFGANTMSLNAFSDAIIDEVRLWSVARTGAQILDGMNRVLEGDELGLDGYWRFDEGAGTVAFDETANANDGTLTNMNAATDWVLADHTPYEIVAYGTTPHVGVLPGADADGDALTYSIVTNGTGGTATVTDAATGAFTYVPTANANGTDSFVYRISDGANTADETVSVTLKSAPLRTWRRRRAWPAEATATRAGRRGPTTTATAIWTSTWAIPMPPICSSKTTARAASRTWLLGLA